MLVDRDGLDNLLVDLFLESQAEAPEEIWLDLDATDDPTHGQQEGRFYHGYYRERWPATQIRIRADAGFCSRRDPELVRSQCGGLRARAGSQPGADLALTPRHAPCAAVLLADRRGGAPLLKWLGNSRFRWIRYGAGCSRRSATRAAVRTA